MHGSIDRRGFLGLGGSALICTIGGKKLNLRTVGDVSHDVELVRGPKGVRAFASGIANTGYAFKRRLTRPGTYLFDCSLHPEMWMQVKVR